MSATEATGGMNSGPLDWDAETYDTISDPQFEWGVEVLERLELRGDETVIDAGSGTGRVTAKLLERLPEGRVIAVDGSEAMVVKAREALGDRVQHLVADLSELEVDEPVDVVFSTATFHWILDHDRLFRRLHAALRPGGRLVAQCGGQGNVAEHARVIAEVALRAPFSSHYQDMPVLWNFAAPEETEMKLHEAGFDQISCWLDPKPVQPERPYEFISTVTLGPHLALLSPELRRPFAEAVIAEMEEPITLDYVRLNIEARRP